MRILIATGQDTIGLALKKVLDISTHSVEFVESGEDILAKSREDERPDVLIYTKNMDIRYALRPINERFKKVILIGSPDDEKLAIERNHTFLRHPLSLAQLLNVLS